MDNPQIDQTGIPSAECINCGSSWFRIYATFDPDDYEVAAYLIDNAQCAICDAEVTVPTPIDLPNSCNCEDCSYDNIASYLEGEDD